VGITVSERTSLSRWLLVGTPSAVALGVLGVAVLHFGFKIPLKAAMLPVVVLLAIEVALYLAMYWIRTRFQQTRDLRPAVMAFGAFTLASRPVDGHAICRTTWNLESRYIQRQLRPVLYLHADCGSSFRRPMHILEDLNIVSVIGFARRRRRGGRYRVVVFQTMLHAGGTCR
jgi:hypothetical protein